MEDAIRARALDTGLAPRTTMTDTDTDQQAKRLVAVAMDILGVGAIFAVTLALIWLVMKMAPAAGAGL